MKHLRFYTGGKQVDQNTVGWPIQFFLAVLLATILASSSLCAAADMDTGSWSFCFDNASVSAALVKISDKTGIRITTHGAADSKPFERCYTDRSVEEILADIFRTMNHAMVWDFNDNRISAVTIWVSTSVSPMVHSPSPDWSAWDSNDSEQLPADDLSSDHKSEKKSHSSPTEGSQSQFLKGIDYPEFAPKGAAWDPDAASRQDALSDPELSDESEAAAEASNTGFEASSGAGVDRGDPI